jgi:hypothetical protein
MKTIFVIILVFILCSCEKYTTVQCPAMPEDVDDWLPYNLQDSLVFKNTNGLPTIKSNILSSIKSPSYEEKELNRFNSKKVNCNATYKIGTSNGLFKFEFGSLNMKRIIKNRPEIKSFDGQILLKIVNSSFNFRVSKKNEDSPIELFDINTSDKLELTNGVIIANKVYNNVIIIKQDTTFLSDTNAYPKNMVWKLVYGKNTGVIAFYMRGSNQEWIRQ